MLTSESRIRRKKAENRVRKSIEESLPEEKVMMPQRGTDPV